MEASVAIGGADLQNEDIVEEPKANMIFNDEDEAYLYYAKYAKMNGFGVAKKSRKRIDGELKHLTFECSRGGKPKKRGKDPLKPRRQTKIDCPARLNLARNLDWTWRISSITLEHNHNHTPGKNKFYKSNRVISESVKRKLELNNRAGVNLSKTYTSLQIQAGGHENLPFTERDLRNYSDGQRRLKLVEGDAQAMYTYFKDMCDDNSDFFYLLDADGDNRLRNVFWADARSRAACKEFGEVVTFDATYLTNKYHMPFAPFVGVNHHGQSILLGCGLISHEDTESYSWLMRAWKSCMGSAPRAIITDQCMAMKNAIEEVFPDTRHRWCIWHIMKKIPEKFGKCGRYVSISFAFRTLIYESMTIESFEVGWELFIKEYGLEENKWLDGLYKERNRWVPAFVNDVFWAGMQSTQRSESMNSYFDGYIHEKTTLKTFVEQYENALATKVAIEANADLNCSQSFIPTVMEDDMETQFQNIYTNAKAQEFQKQFVGKLRCTLHEKGGGNDFEKNLKEFEIFEMVIYGEDKRKKRCLFHVKFDYESNETKCVCRLFESSGIVCKHQLMVWAHMRVQKAPEKYLLRRWRKDVTRIHDKIPIKYAKNHSTIEAFRCDYWYHEYDEVINFIASCGENFNEVIKVIRELKQRFRDKSFRVNSSNVSGLGTTNDSFSIGNEVVPPILDPNYVRRKGRSIIKRKEGFVEKIVKKKKKDTKDNVSGAQEHIPIIYENWNSSYGDEFIWPNLMTQNETTQVANMKFTLIGWNGQSSDMPSSSRCDDK